MPEAPALAFWRIASDTPEYTADALSGAGAERSGGRWNARGQPLVYASSTRALACLEPVVHLGGGMALPLNRYLVRLDVPAELWAARTVFDAARYVGLDALPSGRTSIAWGMAWAQQGASCLAEVPSVIVPEERNLLLNPRHPDAHRVKATKLRRWLYDARTMAAHHDDPRRPEPRPALPAHVPAGKRPAPADAAGGRVQRREPSGTVSGAQPGRADAGAAAR